MTHALPTSDPAGMARDTRYPLGVAMVLAGGCCLSLGGLLYRQVETTDVWLISLYRSIGFFAVILCFLLLRYRGRILEPFLAIGRGGLVVTVMMGFGSMLYLFSISLTTVANVMFILATAPLVTAVMAWILLRERVRPVVWVAMAVALSGVGVMVGGVMVGGGLGSGRLAGNVVALGAVLAFAGMVITIRRVKTVDMVPAVCLGGLLGAVASAALAGGLAISSHDLGIATLLGVAQVGAGFLLITLGTRYVPAGEVALLAQSEIVLSPIWVWFFVNEVPSTATLIGGALVLAAVFGSAIVQLRREAVARA